VIYPQILGIASRILLYFGKRPNTIVCLNGIISQIKECLTANIAAKYSVTLVLDIILLVALFIRIYLGVGIVKREVEEVFIRKEVVLNFSRGSARP